MRMIPTRRLTANAKPLQVKTAISQVTHSGAPLKGLSLAFKESTGGDPQTASILTNWVIEDDRIQVRAGHVRVATHADLKSIEQLIPWYGPAPKLLAATNGKLADALTGADVKTGFSNNNDWSWTSFANLGQQKFTVMCNGSDGVWSWDGTLTADTSAGVVNVTNLSKSAVGGPAVCTVAPTDIGKFANGQTVLISGAVGTGMTVANGYQIIASVNSPANTFQLVGIDTSTASGPQTSGVTADPIIGGIVKETVTAPTTASWVVPDQFNVVLSHMNRLWFADSANLAVYYLPLQQKSGEVKVLPLNALFKRGGYVKALHTWTVEGGTGTNDQLVIFSSNDECVIYQGTDPDADYNSQAWSLQGIFRFDTPVSKHCCVNYGGDLYVLISTGLVPLSTMLRAESEQLGKADANIVSLFREQAISYRDRPGWSVILNPSSGRLICNMPKGAPNQYRQAVRHMPSPRWTEWSNLPSRSWAWIDPWLYFGDDSGNTYRMHPSFQNDNGLPIRCDVLMAWSQFKTPALKHFKGVRAYFMTDGSPKPRIDVQRGYDYSDPINEPDGITTTPEGATWDVADWATDTVSGEYWVINKQTAQFFWQGVATKGNAGAPRLVALVKDCTFSVIGFDVLTETGAAVG